MVVSRVNHKLLHIVKIDGLFDVRLSNVMRIILDKDWQIPSKVGTDSVLIFTDNNKESFILIKLLLVDDHELVSTDGGALGGGAAASRAQRRDVDHGERNERAPAAGAGASTG